MARDHHASRFVRMPQDHVRSRLPAYEPAIAAERSQQGISQNARQPPAHKRSPKPSRLPTSRGRSLLVMGSWRAAPHSRLQDGARCTWSSTRSGGRDSNPRQPAWKAGTLPTELPPRWARKVYAAAPRPGNEARPRAGMPYRSNASRSIGCSRPRSRRVLTRRWPPRSCWNTSTPPRSATREAWIRSRSSSLLT